MSMFKRRKPRQFKYEPRYTDASSEGNIADERTARRKRVRMSYAEKKDLIRSGSRKINIRLLIILLLLAAALYIVKYYVLPNLPQQ